MKADKYLKPEFVSEKGLEAFDEISEALITLDARAHHLTWLRTGYIQDEKAHAATCDAIVERMHKNDLMKWCMDAITHEASEGRRMKGDG